MFYEKYSKNYLNEVIFQIRFSPLLQLFTDEKNAVADFQNKVIDDFPEVKFEEIRRSNVKLASIGIHNEYNNEFLTWVFTNKSGKYIRLNGEELILGYSGEVYSSFDDFLKDVKLVTEALKQYKLPQIKSIGLRYINQIRVDDKNKWSQYINPNLHLINGAFNEDELIQSINKTNLKIQDYDLIFQFGQFNPEYPNISSKKDFVLDYDCILVDDEPFENIFINLNKMHEIIYNRFESDIMDGLREKMR